MNIIAKLTLKTMSKNKKRTIVTIIGVVISVAMIMAVSTIAYSFTSYMGEGAMRKTGEFHVVFEKLPYENKDEVLEGDNIGDSFMGKVVGDYDVKNIYVNGEKAYEEENSDTDSGDENSSDSNYNSDTSDNGSDSGDNNAVEYKTVLRVIGLDEEGFEKIYFGEEKYMEGKYPENENEIMVSSWYAAGLGINETGDVITLDGKDYTVCGIYAAMDFETKKISVANQFTYAAFTYCDLNSIQNGDYVNIYSKLKDLGIGSIYGNLEEIASACGAEGYYDNSDVLYYYGVANNSIGSTMNVIKYTLIVIIMIGAVSLIANGFSISLSERSKYLGMIASIGATKKQKRYSVFFEGFIVGIISIPLGIISGYVGTAVVFKVIEGKINSIAGDGAGPIKAVVQPWIIISVIIFSVVTIFLSAYIPARRASRITPIDAIRQTKDIKIGARQVKTRKITRRLFGFEGELALKNLKRNKKKYAITIFSMAVSIVLFLTVYSFVFYLTQSSEMVYSTDSADMTGSIYNADDETYEKIISEAAENPVFGEISFVTQINNCSNFSMKKEEALQLTTSEFKDYYKEIMEVINSNLKGDDIYEDIEISVSKYDEQYLTKFLEDAGLSYSDFVSDDRNIIVVNKENTRFYFDDGPKLYEYEILNAKKGDDFTLKIEADEINTEVGEDNSNNDNISVSNEIGLKIYALTDEKPLGINMQSYVNIIVTENMFNNIVNALAEVTADGDLEDMREDIAQSSYSNYYVSTFFNISGGDETKHTEEMDKITEKYNAGYYGSSTYELNKENQDMLFIIEIFTYGFIVLMTLVCAANIFNTISTGITLRKREFATLRSVGMTKNAFNKMIMYESGFYGMKALLYGFPISFLIMLFLWKNYTDTFDGISIIPWKGIIIAAAAVFIVTGSSMLYAASKIKKANIVDGLKDENI